MLRPALPQSGKAQSQRKQLIKDHSVSSCLYLFPAGRKVDGAYRPLIGQQVIAAGQQLPQRVGNFLQSGKCFPQMADNHFVAQPLGKRVDRQQSACLLQREDLWIIQGFLVKATRQRPVEDVFAALA